MSVAQGNDRPRGVAEDAVAAVELEVAHLLRRAERTRVTGERGGPRPDGSLDRSGYLLLHALRTHGPQHVTALAERLGLDGSTVTRQVVTLERAGHVVRARDPLDGRAVVVEPTSAGLDQLERHRTARSAVYADVLDGWSPLDRALLAELLARLNDDLDDYRRRRDGD